MSRKVHITKKENDHKEVGVQVRTTAPTAPLESRLQVNRVSKDMFAHLLGQDIKLNIGVYAADPTDSFNQVWINDTESKLKWRDGATIYEMDLPTEDDLGAITTIDEFYEYLNGLDKGNYRDAALQAPSAIYDTFSSVDPDAGYTNVRTVDNSLRNDDDNVTGTYAKEVRQSTPATHLEGALAFESLAIKPKTVIDNLDGTHNVVLSGDLTDLLSNGKKFYVYEEVEKVVNQKTKDFVEPGTHNRKAKDKFPLLGSDLEPVEIDVASYSYNGTNDETTIIFNDLDEDLTLGFLGQEIEDKVRFLPKINEISAGANGLGGVLDNLKIRQMLTPSEESNTTTTGVIGHDVITKLHNGKLNFQQMNYMVWKHSPNKQYWLLLCRYGFQGDTDRWYIWYSRDGLNSIQFHDEETFLIEAADTGTGYPDNEDHHTREFFAGGWEEMLWNDVVHVSDEGKFVFSVTIDDRDYNRWKQRHYYGRMDDNKFIIQHPADSIGGRNGESAFENNTTHSYYQAGSAIDWESGVYAHVKSRGNNDAYLDFWYLDFDSMNPSKSGHINYTYMGTDYRQHHYPSVMFWGDFEGERMLFEGTRHLNAHFYARKVRLFDVLNLWKGRDYTYINQSHTGTTIHYAAFTDEGADYENLNRSDHTSWMHEIAAGTTVDHWFLSDDKVLTCFGGDNNDNYSFLSLTDFGRTTLGTFPDYTITFDQDVDAGVHSINKVDFDAVPEFGTCDLDITGDVNSHVAKAFFNAEEGQTLNTNIGIENDWISTLAWIGLDEIQVDGDPISGFTFNWKHRPEAIAFTPVNNTLKAREGTVELDDQFDTIIPPVGGPEILTNGTFDLDISSWTDESNGTGSIAHSTSYGGSLQLNHGGNYSANRPDAYSELISLTAGLQYTFKFTLSENNTAGNVGLFVMNDTKTSVLADVFAVTPGDYFVNYTPSANEDVYVRFGVNGHSLATPADALVSDSSVKQTLEYLADWTARGPAYGLAGSELELRYFPENTSNGAIRLAKTNTSNNFFAEKEVVLEVGEYYMIEFDILEYQKFSGNTSHNFVSIGPTAGGFNAQGYLNSILLRPSLAWDRGNYKFLFGPIVDPNMTIQFGHGTSGLNYNFDATWDNIKIEKLKDVIVTTSVLQAGSVGLGGDCVINMEYYKNDVLSTSGATATIYAGDSMIAIRNKLNAITGGGVGVIGGYAPSTESEDFLENRTWSRLEKSILFVMDGNRKMDFEYEQRQIRDGNPANYYNLELTVGAVGSYGYDLQLEIYEPETGNILWDSGVVNYAENSGQHIIAVPWQNIKSGCLVRGTSYVENQANYSNAKIRQEWRYTYVAHSVSNQAGFLVSGDWTSAGGINIKPQKPRDFRPTLSVNNLLSGGFPVTETIVENQKGRGPAYLKYDNNAHVIENADDSKFFANVRQDGVSYRFRGSSRVSSYVLGQSVSTFNQHHRGHGHQRGDSLLFATDMRIQEYSADPTWGSIIKIPNIKEYHGQLLSNNTGTQYNLYLSRKDHMSAGAETDRTNTKWGQRFSVPDKGYSSGTFPLRTVSIAIRKNWSTHPRYFTDDAYVQLKVVGTIAGFPDESNVLATSITKLPLTEIPTHTDGTTDARKYVPFIFNNDQLTPAQDVVLIVEIIGLDVETMDKIANDGSVTPSAVGVVNNFYLDIAGKQNVSGDSYGLFNNVWTNEPFDMWFVMWDHYHILPHLNHESGPNLKAKIYNGTYYHAESQCRGVADSTLGVIGDYKNSNQFVGTYQSQGYPMWSDIASYSRFNTVKAFTYLIDNENIASPEHPPILKDPKPLGVKDESKWDGNLIMAHAFGYTPDNRRGLLLQYDGEPEFLDNGRRTRSYNGEPNLFRYNHSVHFGGFQLGHEDDGHYRHFDDVGSLGIGSEATRAIFDDPEFRYGRCNQLIGSRMYMYYNSRELTPWLEEFVFEYEFKARPEDVDGGTSNNMVFGSDHCFYTGFRGFGVNGEARYHTYLYNNWIGYGYYSEELVPVNVYHRIRIQRSHADGFTMWRNFSKEGGTWEQLTIDTVNSTNGDDGSFFKNGKQIGISGNIPYSYFAVGGWTNNTSHQCYGRLGYMKLAIGSSSFVYDGLDPIFEGNQPELIGVRNAGDRMIAYDKIDSGHGTVRYRTAANPSIVKHPDIEPSKVNTSETVVRYEETLTDGGRDKSVQIDTRREDVRDPAKVNGYILEFIKK